MLDEVVVAGFLRVCDIALVSLSSLGEIVFLHVGHCKLLVELTVLWHFFDSLLKESLCFLRTFCRVQAPER